MKAKPGPAKWQALSDMSSTRHQWGHPRGLLATVFMEPLLKAGRGSDRPSQLEATLSQRFGGVGVRFAEAQRPANVR